MKSYRFSLFNSFDRSGGQGGACGADDASFSGNGLGGM